MDSSPERKLGETWLLEGDLWVGRWLGDSVDQVVDQYGNFLMLWVCCAQPHCLKNHWVATFNSSSLNLRIARSKKERIFFCHLSHKSKKKHFNLERYQSVDRLKLGPCGCNCCETPVAVNLILEAGPWLKNTISIGEIWYHWDLSPSSSDDHLIAEAINRLSLALISQAHLTVGQDQHRLKN